MKIEANTQTMSNESSDADVFISHSTKNLETAKEIQATLKAKGVSSFLAPVSLTPGVKWSSEILRRLRQSKFVLFLATKDSCESKYVNQEIGGAILMEKPVYPILCGVSPEELPGWSKDYQAVELREDRSAVGKVLDSIADKIKLDKLIGFLILIGLGWLLWMCLRSK